MLGDHWTNTTIVSSHVELMRSRILRGHGRRITSTRNADGDERARHRDRRLVCGDGDELWWCDFNERLRPHASH